MLLTKQVEVLLHGDRIKYYEDLGYEIPRVKNYNYNYYYVPRGSKIIVNVEDLAKLGVLDGLDESDQLSLFDGFDW